MGDDRCPANALDCFLQRFVILARGPSVRENQQIPAVHANPLRHLPPSLAYLKALSMRLIPANSTLVFDIELIEVKP